MGEGGMGGGMPRMPRQTKQDLLFDRLKLSSEQKEAAQQILAATTEKAASARDALGKGRQAIATALLEKRSDDEVKKLLADYTKLSVQMTGFEAEAFGKICALLKPNQQAKAAPAFELMAGIFAGGGRGQDRGERGRQ
jgi:hypothetical protein